MPIHASFHHLHHPLWSSSYSSLPHTYLQNKMQKCKRSMAVSTASALVSSRFYFANSVLFGCAQKKHIARLQRSQHALDTAIGYSSPLVFLRHTSPTFYSITSPTKSTPLTFRSAAQPFIWFSCFSYLVISSLQSETLTLFRWTSSKDPLLSISLSRPLRPSPVRSGPLLRLWRYVNK